MDITPGQYEEMGKARQPKSRIVRNVLMAYLIGGLICVLGEALSSLYSGMGISKETVGALTSVTLIALSIILTGLRLYRKIAKVGGAGTLVPITGFANAVVSPAIEFKHEGYILGLGAKLFLVAGPVIVYGVSASVIYGIILFLMGG